MKIYKYQEWEFEDTDDEYTVKEVQRQAQQWFPELAKATTKTGKNAAGIEVITFVKRAGTKGNRHTLTNNDLLKIQAQARAAVMHGRFEMAVPPEVVLALALDAYQVRFFDLVTRNEAAHTPGPWRVGSVKNLLSACGIYAGSLENPRRLALCYTANPHPESDEFTNEDRANALLIAAAPGLAEVARCVVEDWFCGFPSEPDPDKWDDLPETVEAAMKVLHKLGQQGRKDREGRDGRE